MIGPYVSACLCPRLGIVGDGFEAPSQQDIWRRGPNGSTQSLGMVGPYLGFRQDLFCPQLLPIASGCMCPRWRPSHQ